MSKKEKVKNTKNNNIDISGNVTDSTISINQNQDGSQGLDKPHIEYYVEDSSYREVSSKHYEISNKLLYTSIGLTVLSLLADMAGVLSYFGVNSGVVFIFLVFISILIATITKDERWVADLNHDKKSHYKNGQWYEKLANGNIAIYYKRAKCIYPKCNGVINVVPAPQKEYPNHDLVGKCTVGGVQHTYTIDFNGIGYPQKFDWESSTD